MNLQSLLDPTVIIALITALGGGTLIQQLLSRKQIAAKSAAEIDQSAVAASKEVVAMLREDNRELRAEVDEVNEKLDSVLREVRRMRDWRWDANRWMRVAWADLKKQDPNYPSPPLYEEQ